VDAARTHRLTVTRVRVLAVVLALLAVGGVVVGVTALVRGPDIPAYADAATRQDARAAAEKFAASVNTYDVTDLDPYVERVTPLLTDDLAQQFEDSTTDLLAKFAEAKIKSTGEVKQVAIESIDGDSAEALASISVTTAPSDVQAGQPRLRWRISLVRDDDGWLVDNFASVPVEAESPKSAPESPAPEGDS